MDEKQTIYAHDINMSNGSAGALTGGTDTTATITAGWQAADRRHRQRDADRPRRASIGTAPGGPGVRIGAGGASTPHGTDLTLLVDGNVELNGGTAAGNGASIGSSGAAAICRRPHHVDAGGSVALNAGTPSDTGVRIGYGGNGPAGGNISIKAGGAASR